MKRINIDTWDRKEHYHFFRRSDYAHYHIGTDLDITGFKTAVKERGIPFSFAVTYAVTAAMNEVEEFRYRIQGDDVRFCMRSCIHILHILLRIKSILKWYWLRWNQI